MVPRALAREILVLGVRFIEGWFATFDAIFGLDQPPSWLTGPSNCDKAQRFSREALIEVAG